MSDAMSKRGGAAADGSNVGVRAGIAALFRRRERLNHATASDYFYLVPAALMVTLFVYYGIFFNIDASLYDWNGLSPDRYFLGAGNYEEILGDRAFRQALTNTAIWSVVSITLLTVIGFLLAVLMSTAVRFKGLISSLIMIPSITATVVVAFLARKIMGGEGGELNELLQLVGLGALARPWLADPNTALYALLLAHTWQWTGFSFLLYFAALTLVSHEVVEAAVLDGAGLWRSAWDVLFPMCRPTTFALIILGVIQSLKTFDIVYLTTGGGPGRATEVLSTYLFDKALLESRAGYAAAISIVLVVIALIATSAFLWLQRRKSIDD
jgi:raffinose/stachyose/melibiose transport system permease protein